jgi:hypothetical protein
MKHSTPSLSTIAAALAVSALTAASHAQDMNALLNQQMAATNARMAAAMQQSNNLTQQINQAQTASINRGMQDPKIQAAYRQHLGQAQQRGQRPYDFPTFAHYYLYTNGFSAQGMAHMRSTEAGNLAREQQSWRGVQAAEANRAAAQAGLQQSRFNNQTEAGRGLMGNSTFSAGNGSQVQLPHTWHANSTHQYQGNTYHVDQSGKYWAAGANGYWYPLSR